MDNFTKKALKVILPGSGLIILFGLAFWLLRTVVPGIISAAFFGCVPLGILVGFLTIVVTIVVGYWLVKKLPIF